jgi:hypothetical protein
VAVLSALLLLSTAPARAERPAVRDEAGLFSKGAVEQAEKQIADLRRDLHRGLVIETVKHPPADVVQRMQKGWWRSDKSREFARWALEYVKTAEVDGVYVLLYRDDQGQLWAHAFAFPEEANGSAFTPANARKLSDLIQRENREHGLDRALLSAVARVRHDLKANTVEIDPDAVGWPLITTALGVGLGLLLVLGVIKGRLLHREAQRTGAPTEGMSPALMGNLFGNPAAGWVYDQLLARERPPVTPRPPSNAAVEAPPAARPEPAEATGG